ncbi:MAG: hypothetical protein MUC96_08545 [Myxococcaceae bacterium]|nr:hypothetical protein [Myxococcaceae bacterium]
MHVLEARDDEALVAAANERFWIQVDGAFGDDLSATIGHDSKERSTEFAMVEAEHARATDVSKDDDRSAPRSRAACIRDFGQFEARATRRGSALVEADTTVAARHDSTLLLPPGALTGDRRCAHSPAAKHGLRLLANVEEWVARGELENSAFQLGRA